MSSAELAAPIKRVPRMRRTLLGVVPIESPLYRLHPVTRFLTLITLGVVPMFIDTPEINLALILFMIVLLQFGKVDLSQLKIYMPLVFTVAFFMFTVSIAFPGNDPAYTRFSFLGLTLYWQPLRWTFTSYIRLMAMLLGTIQYFSTNRERDTLVALRSLRIPFVVTYFVSLSLRSAGMFMEDLRTIREAERARGLDESAMSLRDRAKLYVMYMIPLFTLALRRADEISGALFARGYTFSGKTVTGDKRSDYILTHYRYTTLDYALIALQVVVFFGVFILRHFFTWFTLDWSPVLAWVYQNWILPGAR